jgi:hypothetical protein
MDDEHRSSVKGPSPSSFSDQDQLESLLIEGLESGEPMPLDAQEWDRMRAEVRN